MTSRKRGWWLSRRAWLVVGIALAGLALAPAVILQAALLISRPPVPSVTYPGGARFGFAIVDDTDRTSVAAVRPVYELLYRLGIPATKTVWVEPPEGIVSREDEGETLADPGYLDFVTQLRARGFEIAYHGARGVSTFREGQLAGLERFRAAFGHHPNIHINHSDNRDNLYWGAGRLDGWLSRSLYRLAMPGNRDLFQGHDPQSPYFWGDVARDRVTYVRNFVFRDVNTLAMNPSMPYSDPRRPFVRYWFSSSDGEGVDAFNRLLARANLDRLEAEGGACIVYTHFGYGFISDEGQVNAATVERLRDLASRNGYFATTSELLDHLRRERGRDADLPDGERLFLQLQWAKEKVLRRLGR